MLENILLSALILGALGGILGLLLAIAAKVFAVKVDESLKKIRDTLPGANCGACGYIGCDSYAEAILKGEAKINLCTVGGDSVSSALSEITGETAQSVPSVVARVRCNGNCSVTTEKYDYSGINSCASATKLFGGHKSCMHGCLGHGDCVRACPYDAISIVGGIAKVIDEKCKACGLCLKACPKDLIELVPKKSKYTVMCRSKDKGAITKKNCKMGCIGCRLCGKACEFGAITFLNNLATIDPLLCTNCGACEKVCPTHAIVRVDG